MKLIRTGKRAERVAGWLGLGQSWTMLDLMGGLSGVREMQDPKRRAKVFEKDYILERLRANVIDYRFGPGKHLKIDKLRKDYDTNTGQIKLALNEIASEGLIEHRPNCGYFTREPSWQSVEADYRFEHNLARDALLYAQSDGAPFAAANDMTIRPLSETDPTSTENPERVLTELTADVYARIISLYELPRASEDAIWLKHRLQFFRTIQFEIDPGTKPHLLELVQLFEAHEYASLIGTVEEFYRRHVDGLDRVLTKAFGEPYPGRQKNGRIASHQDANGRFVHVPDASPPRAD